MYKKVIYFSAIFFLFLINIISFSSANFMCGKVLSQDNYSTSWTNVNINYLEQPFKTASCKVSPDGFKYCCDSDDIKGISYAKGKTIFSEVFDNITGYFAPKVSLVTSEEGYDVFDDLILREAIKVNSPINRIIVGQNNVLLNFSFESPFSRLVLKLNSNEIYTCSNCSNFESVIENITSGKNLIEIFVFDNFNRSMQKSINLMSLDYLNFKRTYTCNGCIDNFISSGAGEVNVTLSVNASHPIEGELFDYYPLSWLFLDSNDGISEIYTTTHNKIGFYINNSYSIKTYTLRAPTVYNLRSYSFQSGFDDLVNPIDKVFLYRIFKFALFIQDFSMNRSFYKTDNFFKVTSSEPIVIMPKSDKITQVALFSKDEEHRIRVFFKEDSYYDSNQKFSTFFIDSNLPDNKLDRILIDFKVNKSLIDNQNVSLSFVKGIRQLVKVDFNLTSVDEDYYYFRAYSHNKGSYIILKENKE